MYQLVSMTKVMVMVEMQLLGEQASQWHLIEQRSLFVCPSIAI